MTQPIGCVVVGAGRAGRARIAAVEASDETQLAGVVRHASAADAPSLDAVLARGDVDAVIVCTPNALHFEQARLSLEASKHVVVEFPLAESCDRARALFDLARARGRVLHVGHIERIAPSQLALRDRVRELGPPISGQVSFTGGIEGWIGDDQLAGTPALRALARLHRLLDLFGAASVAGAELERKRGDDARAYRLCVDLRFVSGGTVRLIEERWTGAPRETHWSIRCARGRLESPPASSSRGVFAADLAAFVAHVRAAAAPAAAADLEARELAVLEWIEAIDRLTDAR